MIEVASIRRALDILELFNEGRTELGVIEVSNNLKLSKSTVSRLMYTLKEKGFLIQLEARGKYVLGSRIATLANIYFSKTDLRAIALPHLKELNSKINETVDLSVLNGEQRMCIERIESSHDLRPVSNIGKQFPLHIGASGKLLLTYLTDEKRVELIKKMKLVPYTEHTIQTKKCLREEVKTIRKQGYATSFQELMTLINAVAAPIRNGTGEVVGALGSSGLITDFTPERMNDTIIPAVIETAAKIALDLGYTK